MRPSQWSQAGNGWTIVVDVGQDGSIGVRTQDGRLEGHLRLRGAEQAWALARLLALAVGQVGGCWGSR